MSRAAATPPSSDAGASAARRVPVPPHGLLERPGPLRTAREGLRAGMLWLVAPAGYGKTTLIGQAVAGDESPLAWVSAADAACRR